MQNIQDVTYNCCDLKLASNVLESTTEYRPHVDDDKKTNKKKEDVISSSEFEDVIRSLIINSNHGIREVDSKVRSLNTIGKRIKIIEQNLAQDNMDSFDDILNIPEFLSSITNECKNERGTDITKERSINNSKMIIEILFHILPEPNSTNSSEQSSNCHILKTPYQNLTFDNITAKYKLDFKQRVAFEIMACSYILRGLNMNIYMMTKFTQFLVQIRVKEMIV